MSESAPPSTGTLPPTLARRVDETCNRFEVAWKTGLRPRIEDFLGSWPEPERAALLRELIELEVFYRRRSGEDCRAADYQTRFPDLDPLWLARVAAAHADSLSMRPTLTSGAAKTLPVVPGYEVLGEIGRGGMGVVYKARQVSLNRVVALKMILAGARACPEELARFRAEAEAVARLQHPHIVQIHEVGEHDGQPYFALEFVEGGSLAQKLKGTPLPARQAAQLVETLARAIQAAHQQGVVHRDLKPANVLLAPHDPIPAVQIGSGPDATGHYEPKVTDFGLAKRLDLAPGEASPGYETQTGTVMGTPSYMAPEQAGPDSQAVGPLADVYALGAILYECLTGRPPFRAETPLDTVVQVRSEEPVPPRRLQPKVPRDLETVCLKCLQKEPRQRYASALDLADDLGRWQAGEPIQARPIGPWERGLKWARRRPAVAALSASVLGITVVGLGLVFWQWGRAEVAWQEAEVRARAEARAWEQEREQRQHAEKAQEKAERAEQVAEQRRKQAETQLYFSNVPLAYQEWLAGNASRVEDLLNECPFDHRRWEWHYLKRQGSTGLWTLTGHYPSNVRGVAFSPDNKRLVSASFDKTVRVWDLATGQVVFTLRGHTDWVNGVAFSPDGKWVVSGGKDKTVRFWDARTGGERLVLSDHADAVTAVAFSPDGKQLASASKDRTVKVWDVAAGKEQFTLRGHTGELTCVAFSPDGKSLASGSAISDRTVRIWDAATGKETLRFGERLPTGHRGEVTSVSFHPAGKHLASASSDGAVRVWDVATGQVVHNIAGDHFEVAAVVYSPDGKRLASVGHDQAVRVWDVRGYKEDFALRGHTGWLRCVAFSPDGQRLASAGLDGVAKVWDATAGQEVLTLPGRTPTRCSAVAFSRDGQRVVSATVPDNTVRFWDAATGKPGLTLPAQAATILSLALSPDGKRLVSADASETVKVWDAATGNEILSLQGPNEKAVPSGREVAAVGFSSDGQRLAWAGKDGTVKVWEANTGRQIITFRSPHTLDVPDGGRIDNANAVAFSADGRRFASGGTGQVKVWDTSTGQQVRSLGATLSYVTALAFGPDGRHLASASGGIEGRGALKIWDLSSGRELLTFAGHGGTTYDLAFNRDGTRLASAGQDHTVKVWDAGTGRELLSLRGHAHVGRGLAFSPDGSRLASAGDGLKIWDGTPTREVLTLSKHPNEVSSVAFSPDGKRLASPASNRVILWDATGHEIQSLDWGSPSKVATDPSSPSVPISLAFSPDGRLLAAGGGNHLNRGDLKVWDTATGRAIHALRGHTSGVSSVAFSPDGQVLASASLDKTVKLWNVATGGQAVHTLKGHTDRVNSVVFSPDGRHLSSAGRDGVVRIWDSTTGRELFTLSGHSHYIARLAYSPDGQYLVSAGGPFEKGEVKLWDLSGRKEMRTFHGHTKMVYGVAFSPDGRFIASAGDDRSVRLWDPVTGQEHLVLWGHYDGINRVAFSPDGRFVASAGMDRTVRVWDVTPSAAR